MITTFAVVNKSLPADSSALARHTHDLFQKHLSLSGVQENSPPAQGDRSYEFEGIPRKEFEYFCSAPKIPNLARHLRRPESARSIQ